MTNQFDIVAIVKWIRVSLTRVPRFRETASGSQWLYARNGSRDSCNMDHDECSHAIR